MKKIKGLWVFLLAIIICNVLLSRTSNDIYSVNLESNNFKQRYINDYTYDNTQPQEFHSKSDSSVIVYTLNNSALSISANSYDLGFGYYTADDTSKIKIYSSDYVSADNSGGKIFLYEDLNPDTTYLKTSINIDQDVDSLYILIETKDPSFQINNLLLESYSPVCTDTYFYVFLTILLSIIFFVLLNYKDKRNRTFMLGNNEIPANKVYLLIAFIAFITVLISSLPLLQDGLIIGHDMPFHMARIEGIASGLESGQFPVRVHGDTLNGYGYANSIFYPELLMYIPAFLKILGVSTVTCYKFYIIFINAMTFFLAYIPFKKFTNSRYIGLTLAVIYVLNPYRLICAYYRSALGEFTAISFLPLVIYGLYAIIIGNKKDWPLLVIGATGVLQSHILSTELVAFLAVVIVIAFIKNLFTQEKRIYTLIFSAISTVAVNLWYLVPMLILSLTMNPAVYTRVQSPVGYSKNNLTYLFNLGTLTGLGPHPIGILGLIGLGTYIVHRCLFDKSEYNKSFLKFVDIMAAITIICIIGTTAYFPWEQISRIPVLGKLLDTIQFPYRLTTIISITTTIILAASILLWLKNKSNKIICCFAMVVLSILSTTLFYEMQFTRTNSEMYPTKDYYVSNKNNSLCVGQYEYLPLDANLNSMVGFSPEINSDTSEVKVSNLKRNGTTMDFTYELANFSPESNIIYLPLTYIPGYEILVDGQKAPTLRYGECTVGFVAPSNTGVVSVKYNSHIIFRIFELISLISLIALCLSKKLNIKLKK